MTNWLDKVKNVVLGKPKAHRVPAKPNRKQKRQQQHLLRARRSAANRRKHEKRE